jgi:hypothetical protein
VLAIDQPMPLPRCGERQAVEQGGVVVPPGPGCRVPRGRRAPRLQGVARATVKVGATEKERATRADHLRGSKGSSAFEGVQHKAFTCRRVRTSPPQRANSHRRIWSKIAASRVKRAWSTTASQDNRGAGLEGSLRCPYLDGIPRDGPRRESPAAARTASATHGRHHENRPPPPATSQIGPPAGASSKARSTSASATLRARDELGAHRGHVRDVPLAAPLQKLTRNPARRP